MRGVVFSISMERELSKTLAQLAKSRRVSRSKLIEQICADYVAQEKMAVQLFGDPVFGAALQRAMLDPGVMSRLGSVLREDVSDGQLALWEKGITAAVAEAMPQRVAASVVAAKAVPRVSPIRRKAKRFPK